MNTEQARSLVQELFQQNFNKKRFRVFAVNLLNHIDQSKPQVWNASAIKEAFRDHVRSCERLGTYRSPEKDKLDVLIVHLTTATKLKKARTALRNFVADHLRTRGDKDAALVAFVSPSEKQWRLSYVKMEYSAIKTEDGKVNMQTRLTPARRCSYIVGEGESSHTAQRRFLDLLQDTENQPLLAQIDDAFSVEAVSKEFFEQYKTLFLDLKDILDSLNKNDSTVRAEFAAKRVSTTDFSKKLMGQFVFLYFLQKKCWLGVPKDGNWGDGSNDFLRQLFDSKFRSYKNFFNDILEPLFYDTLATDRGHKAWCAAFNCRMPFLNGGLFEPPSNYDWRETNIEIPNEWFANAQRSDSGDIGTGIFDVFDRYNFTVDEAEPLETEVAVDPEILGRVFEKLLDVKQRKSKGAFYTPREIVHYMCQESLINYLDTEFNLAKIAVPRTEIETFIHSGSQAASYETARKKGISYQRKLPKNIETNARFIDNKLTDITVCDPAIGSGAFPVGMLNEIVRARNTLTPYFNEPGDRSVYQFKRYAIQNCLYGVDSDYAAVEIARLRLWLSLVVDEDDVTQIKPLPNLDYKVVHGDSLLGVKKNLLNVHLFNQLEELKPRYFDATDRKEKEKLKQEINDTIHDLTNGKKDFDFEIYFSEVMDLKRRGGFDVVIGNPPYVRSEAIKTLKPMLRLSYECFSGTADLLVYFYERCVTLLRRGGTISLITSNKFYRAGYGEKLRRFLGRELTLLRLIDFGDEPVFENTIAYASVLVGMRSGRSEDASALAYTWESGTALDRISQAVSTRGHKILQLDLKPEGWRLDSPAVLRLLEKLQNTGQPLREFVGSRVYRGITTGLNKAFVVDGGTRDRLVGEQKACADILKPYLPGRDVNRWRTESRGQWIIFVRRGTDISRYPAIEKHLRQFKTGLSPGRPGGRKPGSYKWYEIQDNIAYWKEFEKTKIISTKISIRPTFAIDSNSRYLANTSYFIPATRASHYLLGLLNSAVFFAYARKVFMEKQGGWFEVQPDGLEQFPIPVVSSDKQKPLKQVVGRILSAKERDADADVGELERELDELVYALYGLTKVERSIVEAQVEK